MRSFDPVVYVVNPKGKSPPDVFGPEVENVEHLRQIAYVQCEMLRKAALIVTDMQANYLKIESLISAKTVGTQVVSTPVKTDVNAIWPASSDQSGDDVPATPPGNHRRGKQLRSKPPQTTASTVNRPRMLPQPPRGETRSSGSIGVRGGNKGKTKSWLPSVIGCKYWLPRAVPRTGGKTPQRSNFERIHS